VRDDDEVVDEGGIGETGVGAGCATVAKGPTAWGGWGGDVLAGNTHRKSGLPEGVKNAVMGEAIVPTTTRRRRNMKHAMLQRYKVAQVRK